MRISQKTSEQSLLPDRLRAFRGLDLNLFVVFAAIYNQGSVTAASEALGITQPAASHSLGRLRESLGDELFVRRGSSIVPTPFAKSIIQDVHQALDILRAGALGEKAFDPYQSTASFHISIAVSFEFFLLPRLLTRISKEAPNVFLSTTRVEPKELLSGLKRGEINLALGVESLEHLEIRHKPILQDDLVTIARKNNQFIKNGLTQEAYLSAKHVHVGEQGLIGAVEDYELARLGLRRDIRARCITFTAAIRTAAATDYLVTLGRGQLETIGIDRSLRVFDFPFPVPSFEAYMLWHASADEDPANAWLRQIILELLE